MEREDMSLTLDAALAFLEGYEDDLALDGGLTDALTLAPLSPLQPVSSSGGGSADDERSEATDSSSPKDTSKTAAAQDTSRFKRARQRKKEELEQVREEAAELEQTLSALKERHRNEVSTAITTRHGTKLTMKTPRKSFVWEAMAMRQKQERLEAEFLNRQLKMMVDAALRQTKRLEARLRNPSGINAVVRHKRFRKYFGPGNPLQDAVALHNLLVEVDRMQSELSSVWERFGVTPSESGFSDIKTHRVPGCGFIIESLDCRALPYEVFTASESMWRFVAFEDGPGDSQPMENGETVARLYVTDVVNGSFRASYTGRSVFRRLVSDDLVLIVWASTWVPTDPKPGHDVGHDVINRQGIIAVQRSPLDPEDVSIVHSFYRMRRDTCGEESCETGSMGDTAVEGLIGNATDCIQHEITRMVQGMENLLLSEQTRVESLSSPSAPSTDDSPDDADDQIQWRTRYTLSV
ncbi:hypothetical protein Poli38472_007261 [Pythium oligandrum]|uniref:Uncharacterized protein n=1 Tax=Pythium oligandrum TaxID=41045 RepID=A0A8K1FE73_PYTOL|nr:hypothetical protein Poli38472_007261 [Pythium oligandrum]|eukprot:TMW59116.1 hypothetical protein Poli38472_007261 [Pythium oligandrum]